MSSDTETTVARAPKRARGKQRVAELLEAAAAVFDEKGYEAATMTEIAARARAPIGSLYQFFPSKEALADMLVQNFVALLAADLQELEARASEIDNQTLVERLFGLLRSHPHERAAALPLAEARMDERTGAPHSATCYASTSPRSCARVLPRCPRRRRATWRSWCCR